SLNSEMSMLQDTYLTNNNSDDDSDNESNELSPDKAYDKTFSLSLIVYIDYFFNAD
ncbi:10063_t:CDS:1, partial [Cetraspora pellucida]